MNILVVAPHGMYADYTASFVHNQAKEYVKLGHRVRVILPLAVLKKYREGGRVSKAVVMIRQDGVEVCYVRYLSLSSFGAKRFNQDSACCSVKFSLRTILRNFRPDVIHAHTIDLGCLIGSALKARLGCPLVVTTHGETNCEGALDHNPERIRILTDSVDMLTCVSPRLLREMRENQLSAPLCMILNGFAQDHIRISEKAPYSFLQVGNLIPLKKNDITIRAFAALRQRYPLALLTIIGDGPEREKLEALCDELDIDEAVRFTGHIPNGEVLAEMGKARFFIMPSSPEGFGIVYLEAMASGCVVIGTAGEGIDGFIVSGKNGFLVPPNDPEAIVRHVDWCLQNPEQADAMIEQGRQAVNGLTWKNNAERYIDLFQALLKDIPFIQKERYTHGDTKHTDQ